MTLILIVEDEDQVRVLAESILEEHGYRTLSASTPEQADAILSSQDLNSRDTIDLLFTDLALHGDLQAGLSVARDAIARIPTLKVLYTTGQGVTDGMKAMFVDHSGFLAKPYAMEHLIIAIENLLGAR